MFTLKPLPYNYEELAPVMSAELLELHYSKHHQAYCDNLNKAVEQNNLSGKTLTEIFAQVSTLPKALENHGGGYFNHEFFWESLAPENSGTNKPSEQMLARIENDFGSMESFKVKFQANAMSLFGSGWVWLVENSEGKLEIQQSFNQESPQMDFMVKRNGISKPVLNLDVWEHAYYPDYKNLRAEFAQEIWRIINWAKVEERLNS